MTLDEYVAAVGFAPENDDLERANCAEAGEPGHYGCGLCKHGLPVFRCIKGSDFCFGRVSR